MAQDNLKIWNSVKQVPTQFLKTIDFGKLKGKSDINPQWRLMAMTQAFGVIGHGWTYRIVRTWTDHNPTTGEVMCFAEVAVKTKLDGEWGEEFSGIGGSAIVEKNKNGIVSNDDGYKMAVTDALSVAFKAIGIAGDIYLNLFDSSKYQYKGTYDKAYLEREEPPKPQQQLPVITPEMYKKAYESVKNGTVTADKVAKKYTLTEQQYNELKGVENVV